MGLTAILTMGACGQGLQSDPTVARPDGAVDDTPDGRIDPPDGQIDNTPDGSPGPDAPPPVRFSACGALGSGGARAIAAARDLPRAVVGFGSGRAVLIDTASLSVRLELPAHDRAVTRAAMSKDGNRSATSSETGEIIVSRTEDGQELARIQTGEFPLDQLALSPDGSLVAAQSGGEPLRLWRVDDGSLLWTRPADDPFLLRFLDDGQTLLSGGYSLVSFRRVTDGTIQREASFEGVQAAPRLSDANGDGTLFVGNWYDGFGLWRTGQKPAAWTQSDPTIVFSGSPFDLLRPQLSPDGATLALRVGPSGIRLARVSDGSVLGNFPGLSASLAFDHAGSILIGDADGTLHRVSTSAHEEMVVPAPPGHGGPLVQVAFSPDGRLLATSAHEGEIASGGDGELFTVKVWSAKDGILLFTVSTTYLRTRRSFAFSPDSARLAVVGPDKRIRVLQASDGHELAVVGEYVEGVAFTGDGHSLLGSSNAGSPRAFRRWAAADGAEEVGFGGYGGAQSFALSPDGSRMAILTEQSPWSIAGMSLWRVTDESPLWSAKVSVDGFYAPAPAFSPDGSQIAISDLQVFAAADGALIKDLRPAGWYAHSANASDVSYSRDGAHVAFTDDNYGGGLRVFRTSDWMPEETRAGAFRTVAFSPTDDRLLLGGNDYIVHLLCQE